MDFDMLIPQNIPEYLDGFNKRRYGKLFDTYCANTKAFFDTIEGANMSKLAEALVAYLDGRVKGLFKSRQICDIQYFLMEYTGPAALQYNTDSSRAFAEEMRAKWAEKHPTYEFQLATAELFLDNFNTAIFGMKMNWGGKN